MLTEHNRKQRDRAARRRAKMLALREKGWTLDRIGRAFGGITKQRVAAILAASGIKE